jgi:protein gp37
MSTTTSIEWARNSDGTSGRSWNAVTGCDKVSPGCGLPRFDDDKTGGCYAENIARRFAGTKAFPHGFAVTLHPQRLEDPLRWRKPTRVFTNSMSDLFHDQVPDEYVAKVFAVMAATPQHTYMTLTKRHARMRSLLSSPAFRDAVKTELGVLVHKYPKLVGVEWAWPVRNAWMGVSTEDQKWADIRIPALMRTPAAVRFVSAEPLLGPINLRQSMWTLGDERGHGLTASYVHWGCCEKLHGLDLVIAGAESGPGAREMELDWVRSMRDECVGAGVAFFLKQTAINGKKIPTPELDGRTWTQMPEMAVAS